MKRAYHVDYPEFSKQNILDHVICFFYKKKQKHDDVLGIYQTGTYKVFFYWTYVYPVEIDIQHGVLHLITFDQLRKQSWDTRRGGEDNYEYTDEPFMYVQRKFNKYHTFLYYFFMLQIVLSKQYVVEDLLDKRTAERVSIVKE